MEMNLNQVTFTKKEVTEANYVIENVNMLSHNSIDLERHFLHTYAYLSLQAYTFTGIVTS